jgi:hypothetical protein
MMRRVLAISLVLVSCGVFRAAAQPLVESERAASLSFADRLTALSPSDPDPYFFVAEEVADIADDVGTRRLATRLYALTYELARTRGRPPLAASAAIGLSAVATNERDRQWLLSVSRIIDPRQAGAIWVDQRDTTTTDSGAYLIATALGQIRSGDGLAARQLIEEPQVSAALDRYDRILARIGLSGGSRGLAREAARWPCSQCANARVIRKQGSTAEYKLCPNCSGNPGSPLTTEQLAAQLRFEAWLLQGTQRSWAAQIAADRGAPLIEAEPSELCLVLNVDCSLVIWRDGEWKPDPNAPVPAPKPQPAPEKPVEAPPKAVKPAPPSTAGKPTVSPN